MSRPPTCQKGGYPKLLDKEGNNTLSRSRKNQYNIATRAISKIIITHYVNFVNKKTLQKFVLINIDF